MDTTLLGWRSRDLELGYLPFLRGMGIAQYTSDPVFKELLRKGGAAPDASAPRPPALGADAVLFGRPYAYGLAIDRHHGVRDTILNLLNDFELTARLAGCRNLKEIDARMMG